MNSSKEFNFHTFVENVREELQDFEPSISLPGNLHESMLSYGQAFYEANWLDSCLDQAAGFKELLGYEDVDMTLKDVMSDLIHPDHRYKVNRIVEGIIHFGISHELKLGGLVLVSYKMRKADGTYIKILRTSRVGKISYESKLITNYSLLMDVTGFDKSDGVEWDIRVPGYDLTEMKASVDKLIRPQLTEREREIILLIDLGSRNKDIADRLFISEHTVKSHRKNLFSKFGVTSVMELLKKAREEGIV